MILQKTIERCVCGCQDDVRTPTRRGSGLVEESSTDYADYADYAEQEERTRVSHKKAQEAQKANPSFALVPFVPLRG